MINEVLEAKEYLEGRNVKSEILYRICYVLAKWHKEQGLSHLEIRNEIFAWSKRYRVHIRYNLNDIIEKALADKQRLKDNVVVKINQADVQEINRRFDSPKTKLVALALLCYAKAYANRDREFALSSVLLGAWVNMHSSNLRRKYIEELINFDYISEAPCVKKHKWNSNISGNRYTMHVPIYNDGQFTLKDNDILDLYRQIFESQN